MCHITKASVKSDFILYSVITTMFFWFGLINLLIIYVRGATNEECSSCEVGNEKRAIIGGKDTTEERPFYVKVRKTHLDDKNNFVGGACGGSVIDKSWVLTAAHCIDDAWTLQVIVKDFREKSNPKESFGATGIVFEDYFSGKISGKNVIMADVALIHLEKALPKSATPIKMCDRGFTNSNNLKLLAIGLGYIDKNQTIPDKLQETLVKEVSQQKCPTTMANPAKEICTDDPSLGTVYKGDSGGPLVTLGKTGQPDCLYGVVSAGAFPKRRTALFARVSEYRDWIDKQKFLWEN